MRWLSGPGPRGPGPGWVQAPPGVELEIRAVWQEDEMPAEVTSAPGYQPFTLGPDSQDWVDGMAEVVDGGNAVYGRPKPVMPKTHRSLASTPPPTPNLPSPIVFTMPAARVQPQPTPRPIVMPDIPGQPSPPIRTLPPRIVMPDIGRDESTHSPTHQGIPEIGNASTSPARQPRNLPDIGGETPKRAPERSHMPEIGEVTPPKQNGPRMPEIGEP